MSDSPQSTGPPSDGAPGASPSTLRRVVGTAVVIMLLILVPAGIGYAVAGTPAATGAVIGSLIAFLIGVTCGTRQAWRYLPVYLVALAASAALGGTWWWVAVVAAIGAAAGWGVRTGGLVPTALVGVLFSVTPVIAEADAAVSAVAFCAAGSVNGVLLARAIGAPTVTDIPRMSASRARIAAVALGLAAGVAGTAMLLWGNQYGYWLPMTVFVLAIPHPGISVATAAAQRIVGTAVGIVVGGAFTLLAPVSWQQLGLAMLLLLGGFLLHTPAWLSPALTSAAIVVILTPPGGGTEVASSRLAATAAGALIIVTVAALGAWWGRRRAPDEADTGIRQALENFTGDLDSADADAAARPPAG